MLNGEKYQERIKELNYKFSLYHDELKECENHYCYSCKFNENGSCTARKIEWLLEEYKEPILTDEEKTIIKDIIKAFEPFGEKSSYITKKERYGNTREHYLFFKYKKDSFCTLSFYEDELFKGMEIDKTYTLEELGL